MPTFTPKSDKELAAENLLPAGEYDFEILGAENKRFNTGSEGIALKVGIYTASGAVRFVNDNLIFVDKAMFKVSQFCKCVGLYARYKAGQLDAEDCKGRAGKCKLKIEPEGDYPAKNSVGSYVVPKEFKKPEQAQSATVTLPADSTGFNEPKSAVDLNDDVPF